MKVALTFFPDSTRILAVEVDGKSFALNPMENCVMYMDEEGVSMVQRSQSGMMRAVTQMKPVDFIKEIARDNQVE